MSKRLRLLSVYLVFTVSAVSTPSHADRVYRLVDHPSFQAGHSLAGTITVADTAPDDSLLETAEILDWQWSLMGPNSYSASRQEFAADATSSTGMLITPTVIYLSIAGADRPDLAELDLSRETSLGPRGFLGHSLRWWTFYTPSQGIFQNYSARQFQGDVSRVYWSGPIEFGFSPFSVIATAIPEPASAGLAMLCIVLALHSRIVPA